MNIHEQNQTSSPYDTVEIPPVDAPPKTIEKVQAELDAANARVSALLAKKDADSADEVLIEKKMAVGLTRAQATSVIHRQRAFDESPHGKMTKARHLARQNSPTRI